MSFSFKCFQDVFGPNFPSVNITGGKQFQQQPTNQLFTNFFLTYPNSTPVSERLSTSIKSLNIRFHLNPLANMNFQLKKKQTKKATKSTQPFLKFTYFEKMSALTLFCLRKNQSKTFQ